MSVHCFTSTQHTSLTNANNQWVDSNLNYSGVFITNCVNLRNLFTLPRHKGTCQAPFSIWWTIFLFVLCETRPIEFDFFFFTKFHVILISLATRYAEKMSSFTFQQRQISDNSSVFNCHLWMQCECIRNRICSIYVISCTLFALTMGTKTCDDLSDRNSVQAWFALNRIVFRNSWCRLFYPTIHARHHLNRGLASTKSLSLFLQIGGVSTRQHRRHANRHINFHTRLILIRAHRRSILALRAECCCCVVGFLHKMSDASK